MNDTQAAFSAADVIEIASKLTLDNDTFVVGGQATNLWAWLYQDHHPDLASDKPFTSQDIDYYGSKLAAEALAAALDGTVKLPGPNDMNTPNTAIVEATFKGKALRIDFLSGVLGVKRRDTTSISIVEARATIDGEEVSAQIPVMHPVNCLKSRIGNMLSPATMRRDPLAFRQLHASVAVMQVYIDQALAEGDQKEALSCFGDLFEYIRSDAYGRRAEEELGIDILGILVHHLDDERLDERNRTFQLQGMIEKIEQKQQGRRDRRAARNPTP